MISIKSEKIITPSGLFDGYVLIKDGKIFDLSKTFVSCDINYDFSGKYLSSGFIDIHTHGAGGYPFINNSVSDVINGANYHLAHGTTTILPTISAGTFSTMKAAVKNISNAKKSSELKPNILGAHLEGPYLSAAQCGAQCPSFITKPIENDYKSLIEEFNGDVARWTYAPENDENGKFCRFLTDNKIIASAGHTNATLKDMKTAVENGCNLITHLYSCTSTVTRNHGFRSLGVVECAFLFDELFVEIIADGKHLPPELINMIVKIKGTNKVALITDSLEIAGTDIVSGIMSGTEFIVEDGVCKLKDRSAFAGSVATADRLVRVMINDCGYDILTAVKMLTEVPAKILNLNKGKIKRGYDADIIVFDNDINISNVFVNGFEVKSL